MDWRKALFALLLGLVVAIAALPLAA